MKNTTACITASLGLALLASCTKVIHVDLNNANAKLVIEGRVSDQPGPYSVHLSKTVNFNDENNFPPVSGAKVVITDITAGIIDTLSEGTPGYYQTHTIQGISGHTYNLLVVSEGATYNSSSTMPQVVPFDSLYSENFSAFGDLIKNIIPVYTDPAGVKNYYHFEEYLNGKWREQFTMDDRFSDGLKSTTALYSNGPDDDNLPDINAGDSVMVEMQCMDEPAYHYFDTFYQATGNADAPANPVTNIQGGALGYFSAYTARRRAIKVP